MKSILKALRRQHAKNVVDLNILCFMGSSTKLVSVSMDCFTIYLAWFLLRTRALDSNLSASEYKHILRIAGKDIDGSKKVIVALSEVRGVGYNIAQVLLQSLNINPNVRVGFLTERELNDIEAAISEPSKAGVPQWYFNRRKDVDTGSDKHLITSDLAFTIAADIEREKSVMSWRGYRHMFGLRVRGQHTRTTGRKGGAVGVKKVGKITPEGTASGPKAAATLATAQTPAQASQPTEKTGSESASRETAKK